MDRTKNRAYFLKLLRRLHKNRLIELSADEKTIYLLPPGSQAVERLLADRANA